MVLYKYINFRSFNIKMIEIIISFFPRKKQDNRNYIKFVHLFQKETHNLCDLNLIIKIMEILQISWKYQKLTSKFND